MRLNNRNRWLLLFNPMTTTKPPTIPAQQRIEIEAALFRKLLAHLQDNPEVQNIDLMNLAYFCRNCFSKWYLAEAQTRNIALGLEQAKELVYGMPFLEYKQNYQTKASQQQLAKFEIAQTRATE